MGLYAVADQDDARHGIEALYEAGGPGRAKALEASVAKPVAALCKVLPTASHRLGSEDRVREALRGAGYFELTRHADRDREILSMPRNPFDHLREDALFAYALAMPGETTRGRIRGNAAQDRVLSAAYIDEADLVQFALDERLRLHGLDPVFSAEGEEAEPDPEPPPTEKPGRNDPCPCGSGKKYKKCCGA